MHERLAKDGLVCMSVSVDQLEDQPAVLAFLQKQNATFANFLLDEESKVWQDYWDFGGPPAVFVFDRAGKKVGIYMTDYADVERLVRKLLAAGK
jgi:hypothetical protein